jgi:shikimate kinase
VQSKQPAYVLLSGFMGVGKSTIGPPLARSLSCAFIDLDRVITAHAGSCVRTIFKHEGEAGFRSRERAALRSVLDGPGGVVALGGGTLVDPQLRAYARASASVITLTATPDSLRTRLAGDAATARPLLGADLEERLHQRAAAYADADVQVATDARGVDAICAEILAVLGQAA